MKAHPILLLVVALLMGGCTTAVPGRAVVTPRLLAAAQAVQACTRAVARIEREIDGLLDAMPSAADAARPDPTAIGVVYTHMQAGLQAGCGYWPAQGSALSAVVLHLARQRSGRSGTARAAITLMITSICSSVESPIDTYDVHLTPEAHAACRTV